MPLETDDEFYSRADAFIDLANEHATTTTRDNVSASFMYSSARFNAWVSATECSSVAALRESKLNRIAYFVEQYRAMLEENMDSYINNFDDYMTPNE